MVCPHCARFPILTSTLSTSPHEDNDLQPNILGDVQVPIYSTTLSQCPSSQKAHVYLVNTDKVELGLAPAVRVLDKIQEELAHWLKKLGNTGFEDYSVWRRREETQFTGRDMRFTEKDMKDCLMKAASTLPWSVIDEPGIPVPCLRNHRDYANPFS